MSWTLANNATEAELDANREWLEGFHATGDSLSLSFVNEFFAPDGEVRFANNPPLKGHEHLKPMFEFQFSKLSSMKHTPIDVCVLPDRIYQSCTIKYTFKNGEPDVMVNAFATIWKTPTSKQLDRIDIYGDFSQVHASMLK